MWMTLALIGDALVAIALLFAVIAGADLRWIVGAILVIAVLCALIKAVAALLVSIGSAAKR